MKTPNCPAKEGTKTGHYWTQFGMHPRNLGCSASVSIAYNQCKDADEEDCKQHGGLFLNNIIKWIDEHRELANSCGEDEHVQCKYMELPLPDTLDIRAVVVCRQNAVMQLDNDRSERVSTMVQHLEGWMERLREFQSTS